MKFPKKVAAIDLGTNSFHMVLAEIDENGNIILLSRDKDFVRLGASANDMKEISKDAIKRAVTTLKAFANIASAEGAEVIAIATSAVREAENKKHFIELIKKETGIDIQVVSGAEEGRLIYNGAIHALPVQDKKVLLLDIGGGSTETVIGKGEKIEFCKSVKLGTVRLWKKFFDKKDITTKDIKNALKYIEGEWETTIKQISDLKFDQVVFTSGTLENLLLTANLLEKRNNPNNPNGLEVNADYLLKIISRIKRAKLPEKIEEIEGIESKRADIILGGALITEYFVKKLGIEKLTYSNYALREGILYDYISNTLSRKKNRFSNLRLNTLIHLVKKYNIDETHAFHIWKLSKKIFESLQKEYDLTEHDKEMLEAASYLHDAGFFISVDSHHKHSYYLIKNSSMPGFTSDESEIIANIARYHRKSLPKEKHDNFSQVRDSYKPKIWILGGILRLTEGLDRRQNGYINNLDINLNKKKLNIKLLPIVDAFPELELWGANRRKDMLEQAIKRKINLFF